MYKISPLKLFVFIGSFASCQFNQSVNKDLTTGAYSRGDGLGCDDIAIMISGEAVKRNEFVYGENVNLVFNDVKGLTLSENKSYPGMSMYIIKNDQDTVLSEANLLRDLIDGTDLYPLQLQANISATFPFQNNVKYKVYVVIWDQKGDGKFTYELPFTIKENTLLQIDNKGLEYSNIYLWNETTKQPVFDKNVQLNHVYILIIEGLEDLELNNEKAFAIFSIELTDDEGNKIISNPNLLSDYEDSGVNPNDLKSQLFAKITFSEGKIHNPCALTAKVKDKYSTREINITTTLEIN